MKGKENNLLYGDVVRSKLLVKNTIVNLIAQIVAVACGLILPRLILVHFGSEVNGVTSSITQFLNYITLLEAGVGGVARAALYKPLANGDREKISAIVVAVEKFFQKIAKIFIIYMLILACIFPYIAKSNFNYFYIASLVVIIGVSTFAQYYFGITYQMLLQADQRKYISNYVQIVTSLVNTLVAALLILAGQGIHIVKFASAIIFVLRPIIFNIYVKKRYGLVKNIAPDNESIAQRWFGLGHHIAFFLQSNTDIFVLTLFTNPLLVSVYAVYKYVIGSLSNLLNSFTNSLEAAFGNLIANDETDLLKNTLSLTEFVTCILSTTAFTACGILIFSFISIYTKGVNDVNYYQPLFAFIFILNEWLTSIRSPSNNLVLAAGHYKQTQKYAYIEAGVNILASILLVNVWGLPGIVFATLCSTLIRSIFFIQYMCRHIVKVNLWKQYGRYVLNIIISVVLILTCYNIGLPEPSSYYTWIILAIPVTAAVCSCVAIFNSLIFRTDFKSLISYAQRFVKK